MLRILVALLWGFSSLVITPDNAAQITRLGRLGAATPGSLWWQGETLYAATSDGTYIYDDLAAEPRFTEEILYPQVQVATAEGGVEVINAEDGIHLSDENGEFAVLPTSGTVVLSPDRVYAAVYRGGGYVGNYREEYPESRFVELWDLASGTLTGTWELHREDFQPPFFSFDSRFLFFGEFEPDGMVSGIFYRVNTAIGAGNGLELYEPPFVIPNGHGLITTHYGECFTLCLVLFGEGQNITLSEQQPYFRYGAGLSPDGTYFAASFGNPRQVVIWNVADLTGVGEPSFVLEGESFIGFSFDSSILLTSSDETHLRRFEDGHLAEFATIPRPEECSVNDVYFSPDNAFVFLRYRGVTCWVNRLYDTQTGTLLFEFPDQITVTFNLDWRYAAYWENAALKLYDTQSGATRTLLTLEGDLGEVLDLNPRSDQALFRGEDQRLYGYDLLTSEEDFVLDASDAAWRGAAHQWLYNHETTDAGVIVTVWDTEDEGAQQIASFTLPNADYRLSPDEQYLVTVVDQTRLDVIEVNTGEVLASVTLENPLVDVVFSPDGTLLAGFNYEQYLFWDLDSLLEGAPAPRAIILDEERMMETNGIFFTPDGDFGVFESGGDIGYGGTSGVLYDLTGLPIDGSEWYPNNIPTHLYVPSNASFSPDGSLMVVQIYTSSRSFLLDDAATHIAELPSPYHAFSPDGQLIVSGQALFSVEALGGGETTPLALVPHPERSITFNADGTRLYTYGGRSVTIRGIADE